MFNAAARPAGNAAAPGNVGRFAAATKTTRWRYAAVLSLLAAPHWALPQAAEPAGIYTCTDDKGRRLTSDRPIVDCVAREQRVLNRDGSLKAIHPPTLTTEERFEKEQRDRKASEVRAAAADAARRDRNLMARYPSEEVHHRAREAALDTVRLAIKASDTRLRELAGERKPLMDESEFYRGKALPLKLKQQLDAVDAATDAQRSAAANQEAELVRINRLYDAELERLRRLWAGATPGTLGAVAGAQPDAAPR